MVDEMCEICGDPLTDDEGHRVIADEDYPRIGVEQRDVVRLCDLCTKDWEEGSE